MPRYEDKIIGLEKQRETARKLRQDIKPRTGQMVGNTYVPPAMTQHLADLLNQGVDAYGDYSKAQKIKGLKDEQQRAFANALKGYQDPTSQMDMEQYDPYATPTYLEQNDPYGISTNDPQALSNALMAQENAKQKGIEQQKMSSLNQMYDVDPVKAQRMQADERYKAEQDWRQQQEQQNQSRWEQTRQDKFDILDKKQKYEAKQKQVLTPIQQAKLKNLKAEENKFKAEANDLLKTGGYGKMTEAQNNAFMFGARMEQSQANLDAIYNHKDYSQVEVAQQEWLENLPITGDITGSLNKLSNNPLAQRAIQAKLNFINAVLRKESGAAIGKDEYVSAAKQYFPKVGDSESTLAQKAQTRALATQTMNIASGGNVDILKKQSPQFFEAVPSGEVSVPPKFQNGTPQGYARMEQLPKNHPDRIARDKKTEELLNKY